jgi:hypothetical protein
MPGTQDKSYDIKNQQQPGDVWSIGGQLDIDNAVAGGILSVDGVDRTAVLKNGAQVFAGGVAAPAKKVAFGQATTASAADTIATGLTTVVAVVVSLDSDPGDDPEFVSATVGDQAGTPVAGSFILKSWKNTGGTDPTPLAATTFTKKVNWVAWGT